jgi:hypothetical protein
VGSCNNIDCCCFCCCCRASGEGNLKEVGMMERKVK